MPDEQVRQRHSRGGGQRNPLVAIDPAAGKRIATISRRIDSLVRLDEETQGTFVDEQRLRRLLREQLPPDFVDRFVTDLREELGADLASASRRRTTAIGFGTLAGRVRGGAVPAEDTFEGLGLTMASGPDDVRAAVQRRSPALPDSLFDPAALYRDMQAGFALLASDARDAVTDSTNAISTARARGSFWDRFWKCFKGKVGWLAALGLAIFATAFFALAIGSGGGSRRWPPPR